MLIRPWRQILVLGRRPLALRSGLDSVPVAGVQRVRVLRAGGVIQSEASLDLVVAELLVVEAIIDE